MTRYELYREKRDWKIKIQKVEEKMKYRKYLYKQKARNNIYIIGLFVFGILSSIMVKDISLMFFSALAFAAWKENNKI